jgi:integrase
LRSDFINKDIVGHILYALTPENRLACQVALETGLRIGDILAFRTADLKKKSFTIREQKTNKKRVVRLRECLKNELLAQSGKIFVFEHRTDPQRHRTRQAVYSDIKRAAKLFRIKENISPHSLRKLYAVDLYQKTGDLSKVMQALNHDNDTVTMIYALADLLTKKRGQGL